MSLAVTNPVKTYGDESLWEIFRYPVAPDLASDPTATTRAAWAGDARASEPPIVRALTATAVSRRALRMVLHSVYSGQQPGRR
ncbi:hypothetical protein [Cryptosporangium aurantiacum]|uniref:hypothetical protein n=1 Tax=Cryptosporangium aurantiacum TaxID=134849 RepID=UPI000933D599|nr:hypothetical protein [Cryptosporangium aurantiacum]